MSRRFEDKTALITGGASGIGRAAAIRFAREGAAVLIADRDTENGPRVCEECADRGAAARFLPTDVTCAADCQAMVAEAIRLGDRLDVLVCSAGVAELAPIPALEEDSWDRVLAVNLKGVFLSCKAAFPALVRRGGGAIVNLASLAALQAGPGFAAYAASKAGVVQLTRVLAAEGAPYGIRANALCPTYTDTPMVQRGINAAPAPAEYRAALESQIPLGRLGSPEEMAAAILFLASDDAAFITGVALPVDGGSEHLRRSGR